MAKESAAERRARKAERRADNIRKAHPGDPAAEKRAQKAERRAENIREYARERESSYSYREHTDWPSSDTVEDERDEVANESSDGSWVAGCVITLIALAGIAWVIETIWNWFKNLF